VIVSASTLLGLDGQPADLAGYGAITAETARHLAADPTGTWRRLLTDPNTGDLLDCGTGTYRPSMHLTDFLLARDSVCVFPSCNQPGYRCDIEHCVPHEQGGPTCPGNNGPACRRHHNCKTHGPWCYTINGDGTFTWTNDTGHSYTVRPPERWNRPGPDPTPTWQQRLVTERELAHRAQTAQREQAFHRWEKYVCARISRAQERGDHERLREAEHALQHGRLQRQRELSGNAAEPDPQRDTNDLPF
jgi:hypothetical protein